MEHGEIHFYDFGGFRLDIREGRLYKGETEVKTTKKALEVLRFFVENRSELLSKDYLLDSLWQGVNVEEKTLMQYVYILRKTLGQDRNGDMFIKTISKGGYCFVADVDEVYRKNLPVAGEPGEAGFNVIKGIRSVSRRRVFAVLAAALIFVAALGYFLIDSETSEPKKIESIAVLPLTQIGDEKDEKLGLGIADILISKLGESDNLVVTPTGSITRYSDRERMNLFELGKSLNVDVVVDGTIQTEGDMVRTIVRLYSVNEKKQIWTGKFDKRYSDIFSLQDEISGQISKELSLTLNTANRNPEVTRHSKNIEAYKAFLKGLYYWNRRSATQRGSSRSPETFKNAIENFQSAIEKDPEFVLAYAYLADTYALINHFRMDFLVPRKEALSKAKVLANRAIELDPNSSEALAALAFVFNKEGKNQKSRALLSKAIKLKPNNATARKLYAWQLLLVDDIDSAVSEMRMAQRLDPHSVTVNIALAQILNFSRQPEEALVFAENALRIAGESIRARMTLAESYEQMRSFDKALLQLERVLDTHDGDWFALFAMSRIKAKKGNRTDARRIFDRLLDREPPQIFYYSIATNYLALGDTDKTLEWIRRKSREDRTNMFYYNLRHDYDLDPLRNTQSFRQLLDAERRRAATS